MNQMNDKVLGGLLFAAGIIVFIVYCVFLFGPKLTSNAIPPELFWVAIIVPLVIIVGAVCFIAAWIGYTLLTTPAPTPIEAPTEAPTTEATSASAEEKKP
jgi:flagellar basal body-associated protein FliL